MNSDQPSQINDSVSIVLCGQAGMGIQSVEYFLTKIFKSAGYNVFAAKEYMSRIRGGTNSTEIRISSIPVRAFLNQIDILIPFDRAALKHIEKRITPNTIILAEKETFGSDLDTAGCEFVNAPFVKIASKIGNKIYANIVAVGTIAALFKINYGAIENLVTSFFSTKSQDVVEKNLAAAKAGYELGTNLRNLSQIKFDMPTDTAIKEQILLSGAEAVALGAMAGGCDFISAYPMSPSTAVLVFLAKHMNEFGIIAEQAEDEIAAINMAIGAWYAGARAMVSTSGGGFALMTEGLSLAAMLESPIVIHLAQRPGPATGLPTRTEQADLELALYAGHGEFPRIMFAPGNIQDAFFLTQKAFNLADKYQIPVFILTDQYLMDTYYNTPSFDLSGLTVEKHVIETAAAYKRYALTPTGMSPRGIPGFGEGLVVADSDEHDQVGHITEDLDLRTKMVDKRLKKAELFQNEIIPPELVGPADFKQLIVCWGSTYNVINEALKILDGKDVAMLHFKQVYPLHKLTGDYLKKAEKTIIVENNATAQFAKLIKINTGIDIDNKVLKYNGLAFSVEELTGKLKKLLG